MNALEEGLDLTLDFDKLSAVAKCGEAVLPVVLQNADTGDVLFVAYANRLAFEETLSSREGVL